MTPELDNTAIKKVMELLSQKGTDRFKEIMAVLLNESMKAEKGVIF